MKKEWQFKAALLCLAAFVMSQLTAFAKAQKETRFPVGITQRTFHPLEPYNWRGAQTKALVTTVWYPAAAGAQEKPQLLGAPNSPFAILGSAAPEARMADAPARFPLIVLSHGTGGTAASMAWLGTQLAAHGYIAAAVNHPGNNGLEAYTTQGFVLWWERAHDLSTLIDHLLADPTLGKRVDPKRIGAAGFSLGGYTMVEIAGGVTDRSNFREFCKSLQADGICKDPPEFPGFMDKFSNADEIAKGDPGMQHSLEHASDSYRDPRVRAIFAMAPALGPAFRPESLQKVSIPAAIVAGSADQNVPFASSAQFFAKEIPRAELTLLPGATHYVFLFTCGQTGKNSRPLLCTDPPGIDRDAIHAKTSRLALEFFRKHL
jgi:predicted dienelactone hydrolase